MGWVCGETSVCVHSYYSLWILSTEDDVPEAIDDTSSSITAVANGSSSDRDSPDGGEEETLPFPVPSSADHSISIEVCVCACVCYGGTHVGHVLCKQFDHNMVSVQERRV